MTEPPQGDNINEYLPWWEWAAANLNDLLSPREDITAASGKPISIALLMQEAKASYLRGEEDGVVDLAHIVNLLRTLIISRTTLLRHSTPSKQP